MEMIFQKLALAFNFSPNSRILLQEAKRMQKLFSSKLLLIHIGKYDDETNQKLTAVLEQEGVDSSNSEIIWRDGNPAFEIINICSEKQVELLIAGALEKENIIKFYIGSVARKLMKFSPCSIMIYKIPIIPKQFKKIFVSIDYSQIGEKAMQIAYQIALREGADDLNVIKEFYIPGLTATLQDPGTVGQFDEIIERSKHDEEEKVKVFLNELNLKGVNVNIQCLYGKEKYVERNYVDENHPDLYIVPSKIRKSTLLDRFIPTEMEHIFEDLPSNILIVR
ncbi:MAG TPA: hypothetical protein DCW42_01655 [Bacteroidetes bacterium]|nr:hypothetical protein [Bacteroidota bacterium]